MSKFDEEFPDGNVPIRDVPNARRLVQLLEEEGPSGFHQWAVELLTAKDLPGTLLAEYDVEDVADPMAAAELLIGVFGVPPMEVANRWGISKSQCYRFRK